MTNGTVSSSSGDGGAGRTLQLQVPGGRATIVVPPGTPVVRLEAAAPARIKPRDHLFAIASRRPDGALVAKRVMLGEGAVVPQM
jgi:hypothetical protein